MKYANYALFMGISMVTHSTFLFQIEVIETEYF